MHQGERFGAASRAALSARPPLDTAEAATARAATLTARVACGSSCWAPLGPPADGVRGFPTASLACLPPWPPLKGSAEPFLLGAWAAGANCEGPDCHDLAWELRACLACGWGMGSSPRRRFMPAVTMPHLQTKHPEMPRCYVQMDFLRLSTYLWQAGNPPPPLCVAVPCASSLRR